jgi:hypothetical protein
VTDRRFRWAVGALALAGAAVLALATRAAPLAAHGRGSGATVEPGPPADDILRQARGYRSWRRFARFDTAKASKAHSGNYVIAWYNDAAAPAATGGAKEFPEGSIIVKENRLSAGGDAASLSVMAKRQGAWIWISASPEWKVFTAADGTPLAGDVGSCAGCHAEAPKDSVYSQ